MTRWSILLCACLAGPALDATVVRASDDAEVLLEQTRTVHEKQQNVGVQICARRAGMHVFSGDLGMVKLATVLAQACVPE